MTPWTIAHQAPRPPEPVSREDPGAEGGDPRAGAGSCCFRLPGGGALPAAGAWVVGTVRPELGLAGRVNLPPRPEGGCEIGGVEEGAWGGNEGSGRAED